MDFFIAILCAIVILVIFYFLLLQKEKKDLKKLLKNYDERQDKSRRGELNPGTGIIESKEPDSDRSSELAEQMLLPPTSSPFPGKNISSSRGIFKALRR